LVWLVDRSNGFDVLTLLGVFGMMPCRVGDQSRPNRRDTGPHVEKTRLLSVEGLGRSASPSRLKCVLPRLRSLNPVAFDGLSRKSKCRREVESGVDKVECLG
jgi:hypothetical protein